MPLCDQRKVANSFLRKWVAAKEASTTIVKRPKASKDSKKPQRTKTANKREFPSKPSVTTAASLFVDAAAEDFEVKGSGGAPEGGESARAGSGGAPEGGESARAGSAVLPKASLPSQKQ